MFFLCCCYVFPAELGSKCCWIHFYRPMVTDRLWRIYGFHVFKSHHRRHLEVLSDFLKFWFKLCNTMNHFCAGFDWKRCISVTNTQDLHNVRSKWTNMVFIQLNNTVLLSTAFHTSLHDSKCRACILLLSHAKKKSHNDAQTVEKHLGSMMLPLVLTCFTYQNEHRTWDPFMGV